MRLGFAFRDQLLPDPDGKGKVGEAVAVEVADLPLPKAELGAPEPVRRLLDALPAQQFCRICSPMLCLSISMTSILLQRIGPPPSSQSDTAEPALSIALTIVSRS